MSRYEVRPLTVYQVIDTETEADDPAGAVMVTAATRELALEAARGYDEADAKAGQ